ncbi:unnamed protein product [Urochloa humidicola]
MDASLLSCWTLRMKQYAEQKGLSVGFLDPMLFSFTGVQHSTIDLQHALQREMKNDFVVGAYNTGAHWILVIIAMQWNIVWYLDSAQSFPKKTYSDVQQVVNWDFGVYMDENMKKMKPKPKIKPKLNHKPQYSCARQPSGSQACGFYVAVQLLDLLTKCNKIKKSSDYKPAKELGKNDLKMVQEMLAEFIVNEVINPKGNFYDDADPGDAAGAGPEDAAGAWDTV